MKTVPPSPGQGLSLVDITDGVKKVRGQQLLDKAQLLHLWQAKCCKTHVMSCHSCMLARHGTARHGMHSTARRPTRSRHQKPGWSRWQTKLRSAPLWSTWGRGVFRLETCIA